MKNLFIILSIVLFSAPEIFCQILEEHFDYPAGDSIGAHGWVSNSGGATNRILVTSPGMEFNGDPSTNIGNASKITNTGQDEYKPFSINQNSGSVYAYFMVRIDTARSGDYFAAMLTSTSASSYTCRAYVKSDSSGSIAFGVTKTTEAVTYTPAIYSRGIVYYLVLKYDFVAGTINDRVSLFVFTNSIPPIEPSPVIGPLTPVTGADVADLGRFGLRQGTASSSPTLGIDGIVVTNSWNTLLPVELRSFTSVTQGRNVRLNWSTVSEFNNSGFEVQRLSSHNGSYYSSHWSVAGFVKGNGTVTSPVNYSFTDMSLNSGKYHYRLKQIDFNGNFEYFDLNSEVDIGIPSDYKLWQNYPNPFNPTTTINYDLSFDSKVSIKLFDLSGREVASLVNEVKTAGYYSINFNASNLSSGIYFYRISAEGNGNSFVSTKKMTIIK